MLKVEHTTLCLESEDRTGTRYHFCHHHRRHRHRHPNRHRRRYRRCLHRFPTLRYNSIIISRVVTQCDMKRILSIDHD